MHLQADGHWARFLLFVAVVATTSRVKNRIGDEPLFLFFCETRMSHDGRPGDLVEENFNACIDAEKRAYLIKM